MATVTLPKIPSKLVDTAFPPGEPRPPWLLNKRAKRKERPFPAPSKTLPCPKEARGRKRSNRKYRVDGYPSREELAKVRYDSDSAFLAKKLEEMRRLEEMNRQRYKQLKRAARAGDLAVTKDGVFESKPCSSCPANTYHKVASLTEFQDPCPGSHMAQHSQWNKKGKRAHEEKIICESFPVTPATSFVPSITTEMSDSTETSLFSMETCCTTAEGSEEWSVDNEEKEEVVYSPAEHMANLVMLDMEEKALIEVLDQEIDAYSKKLQEWSDCQDADVKVEKEAKEKLVGLNTRLQKLDQSGNILVAILHSVDEESQKVMMEREALRIEQKIQEEERILQELLLQQQRELSGEVINTPASQTERVESQVLQPTPPPAHLRPSTSYVRPGRQLRRANPDSLRRIRSSRTSTMPREPSSLTTHSLQSSSLQMSQQTPAYQSSSNQVTNFNTPHAPAIQETTVSSQDDTFPTAPQTSTDANDSKSHFIACEKKKVQDELRDMLTLYANMLQADATHTQSGKTQLLTMVQDFLPALQEAPVESEISTGQVEPSQPSAVTNTAVSPASESTVVLQSQAEIEACPSEDTLTANDSEDMVGSHLACDNGSEAMPDHASEEQVVEVTFSSKLDDDNAQDTDVVEVALPDTALDRVESDSMQDTMDTAGIDVIQQTADAFQGIADREIIQNQSEASQSTVRAEFALDTCESETCHDSVQCEAISDPVGCEAIQTTLSNTQDTANINDVHNDNTDTEVIPDPTDSSAVYIVADSEAIQATAESDVLNTEAPQAITDDNNREIAQNTVSSEVNEHTSDIEGSENAVENEQTDTTDVDPIQESTESDAVDNGVNSQVTHDSADKENGQDSADGEAVQNDKLDNDNAQDTDVVEVALPDTALDRVESDSMQDTMDTAGIDVIQQTADAFQGIADREIIQNQSEASQSTVRAEFALDTCESETCHDSVQCEAISDPVGCEAIQTTLSNTQDTANINDVHNDITDTEVIPDPTDSSAVYIVADSEAIQATAKSDVLNTEAPQAITDDNNREIAQNTVSSEVNEHTSDIEGSENAVENEQTDTTDVDPIQESTESDAVDNGVNSQVTHDSADKENGQDSADGEAVQNDKLDNDNAQDTDVVEVALPDTALIRVESDSMQDTMDTAGIDVIQQTADAFQGIADREIIQNQSEASQSTVRAEFALDTCESETCHDSVQCEAISDPVGCEAIQTTLSNTQDTANINDVHNDNTDTEVIPDPTDSSAVYIVADSEAIQATADSDVLNTEATQAITDDNNREIAQNTVSSEVNEHTSDIEGSENTVENEQTDTTDVDPIQESTESDAVDNGVNSQVTHDSADKENGQDSADGEAAQNTHTEGTQDIDDNQDGTAGDRAAQDTTGNSALQDTLDSQSIQETADSEVGQDSADSKDSGGVVECQGSGDVALDTRSEATQSTTASGDQETVIIVDDGVVQDPTSSEIAQDTAHRESVSNTIDSEVVQDGEGEALLDTTGSHNISTAQNTVESVLQNAADVEILPETGESIVLGTTESDRAQDGSIYADRDTVTNNVTKNNQNTTWDASESKVTQNMTESQDIDNREAIHDTGNSEAVQDAGKKEDLEHVFDSEPTQNNTDNVSREGTTDIKTAQETDNTVDPDIGDREASQATSDSDVTQDTTTGDDDVTQGRTSADVTENVQSSSNQNQDGVTPTIKENNSAQNVASTRAFKKYSRAVMKSQSSSGGTQVSRFLLPKKGVTRSLQSLGLLKNTQFSRTQLQKTPELQQPCKVDLEGAGKDVKTTSSTAGVHVPIIKAHSDTKPKSSTHKKTRRMSLL